MEGKELTRRLRIAFAVAETRQRKLEELDRAIQNFRGADVRRQEAIARRIKLKADVDAKDPHAADQLSPLVSYLNATNVTIDEMLGSLRDV
jgi:hypothetical protein